MNKALYLILAGILFFSVSGVAQKANIDSLKLVAQISEDQLKLGTGTRFTRLDRTSLNSCSSDPLTKRKNMNRQKNTPGRYTFFPSFKTREMGKEASFHDQEAFAGSQLERALDLRNTGFPIPGMGVRERIKYYFFQNFLPFWAK